jgi:hypothetical protein
MVGYGAMTALAGEITVAASRQDLSLAGMTGGIFGKVASSLHARWLPLVMGF